MEPSTTRTAERRGAPAVPPTPAEAHATEAHRDAVIASEERLRLAIDATKLGIWDVDAITGRRTWSDEMRVIIGIGPEVPADPVLFASLVHPDDRAWVVDAYASAFDPHGGGSYEAEFRIRRASDGVERWVLTTGRVSFDAHGRPLRGVGTVLDVTERRNAEAALRESEERLKLALEASGLGSWELDLDSNRRIFSPRSAEIFGVTAEEMLDRSAWARVIHPDDAERVGRALADAIAGRCAYKVEFRVRPPGGEERWIASQAVVRRDASGEARRVIGIHQDITERRRTEEALRASEARYRATQEHAGVGIAEVDSAGRYLRVNEAFCAITGYTRADLVGLTLWDISDPADAAEDRELLQAHISGAREEPYTIEKRYWRRDGSPGWVQVSGSAVRDPNGRFLYAVRVIQDATERKRAEERQALLVNELNHRVKNTLATVQAVVAQSLRGAASPEAARAAIEGRLFGLARAHDTLTAQSWRGADLVDLVADVIRLHGGEGDQCRWEGPPVDLSPELALALAMVLHELATNATKYGALTNGCGGRVDIRWEVAGDASGRQLVLRWAESGGPPVAPPARTGFGTRLIRRSLAADIGGRADLDFASTGLRCTLEVPLAPGRRAEGGRR